MTLVRTPGSFYTVLDNILDKHRCLCYILYGFIRFYSFLYLDRFVLGDDSSISQGSPELRTPLLPLNMVSPQRNLFTDRSYDVLLL